MSADRFVPVEPFHPGEYIQEELEARAWTQEDLAEVMGISRRHVINLITGKSGVTPETAVALEQAIGLSAQTWMNLQVSYELALAAKSDRTIERRAKIYQRWPVRELVRRGWIPNTRDTDELERVICEFLEITSIDETPELCVAAKKGTKYGTDSPAQIAWYKRACQLARFAPASKFSDASLEELLANLRSLAAYAEDARRVPKMLADAGVRLVLVEHLSGTKVDGATLWVNDGPTIALSLRYDRIDNFWHTLAHEIYHVAHRDATHVDDALMETDDSDVSEVERSANDFAASYLVPREKLESFITRMRGLYYRERVVQFAQARGIHPGIVVGQLQRRKELKYSQLRAFLEPIRKHVLGQAITDGWCNLPNKVTGELEP
ncbi:MAG: HigA family addiction module antidote protein [Planctomycetia bacterium]|nr:HigA family addiction module antidote protein [Planctomycetia bacterium]